MKHLSRAGSLQVPHQNPIIVKPWMFVPQSSPLGTVHMIEACSGEVLMVVS